MALHHGNDLREEVRRHIALTEENRLREEDPFTGEWTRMAPQRLVVNRSRFEADLNRPRERAVYVRPADAWGLPVWRETPPPELVRRSLAGYDEFYRYMESLCQELEERWGRFVIFDLHSYNHRRTGSTGTAALSEENPEVNVGTGSLDRARWMKVVDRFIEDLRGHDFLGRHLDVRENVKFQGGYFSRWVHKKFPDSACVLAIEFKKFFMDEWTGAPDRTQLNAIGEALTACAHGVMETLEEL